MTRISSALFGLGLLAFATAALPAGTALAADPPALAARSQALVTEGQKALDAQKLDDAMKAFERAVVAQPDNAQGYSWLGLVHERKGEKEAASKYYRIALEIDPDERNALQLQGQALLDAGELEKAQANLDRLARVCQTCEQQQALATAVARYKANPPAKPAASAAAVPADSGG
ncbi:tetratricopeptide repeat protein [Zavarzinia sp. CC-PAN008]|uniref:tetratricopeptide repeat protein n=1 Tax=Zavarzinia sp. CC-PAN008 TaxID=3243332 RepID=UPI003F748369